MRGEGIPACMEVLFSKTTSKDQLKLRAECMQTAHDAWPCDCLPGVLVRMFLDLSFVMT